MTLTALDLETNSGLSRVRLMKNREKRRPLARRAPEEVIMHFNVAAHQTILPRMAVSTLRTMLDNHMASPGMFVRSEISSAEGTLYMRVGTRNLMGSTQLVFVLSRVDIDTRYQRRGVFKEILTKIELAAAMFGAAVMIENVLNDDLAAALHRYGMQVQPDSVPPTFYRTMQQVRDRHAGQIDDFLGQVAIKHTVEVEAKNGA